MWDCAATKDSINASGYSGPVTTRANDSLLLPCCRRSAPRATSGGSARRRSGCRARWRRWRGSWGDRRQLLASRSVWPGRVERGGARAAGPGRSSGAGARWCWQAWPAPRCTSCGADVAACAAQACAGCPVAHSMQVMIVSLQVTGSCLRVRARRCYLASSRTVCARWMMWACGPSIVGRAGEDTVCMYDTQWFLIHA